MPRHIGRALLDHGWGQGHPVGSRIASWKLLLRRHGQIRNSLILARARRAEGVWRLLSGALPGTGCLALRPGPFAIQFGRRPCRPLEQRMGEHIGRPSGCRSHALEPRRAHRAARWTPDRWEAR